MWFGVVSLFPEMFELARGYGVLGRAMTAGSVIIEVFNPRTYTSDRHQSVDDRPYGGGPGMVMLYEPLVQAIEAARTAAPSEAEVVYLSPQGQTFTQKDAREVSNRESMILICGRYEGIDQRVIERVVDRQLSIGDYVLSGGELAALVVIDAAARLLPGTVGNQASIIEESHLDGLLDYPQYTRPEIAGGLSVPAVLMSGDHNAIKAWRRDKAVEQTYRLRPEMLTGRKLTEEERLALARADLT
ncbi:MAG: tRNA (guanosine(37)-N1)-methyltransferase TrmD [Proteobacteria bacterium]|nr:tRNA (guanosine(37)-N1)-methyltransferase TrmD [Pseudomonadota bacterium]